MKHTPGPWFRIKALGSRWWTLGRIIDHTAEPLPEENFEADWSLAEAAPEMFLELRCAVAELKQAIANGAGLHLVDSARRVIEAHEKVIAKAEGSR